MHKPRLTTGYSIPFKLGKRNESGLISKLMNRTRTSWNASDGVGVMDVFLSRPVPKRWLFSQGARMVWTMIDRLERIGLYLEPREVHVNERLLEVPFVLQRLPKSGRFLDVGCVGSSLAVQLACLGYKVTAVDVRDYEFRHPNLDFRKEDILNSTLEPNSYDGAVLISTLEHMGLGHYGDSAGLSDRQFLDHVARFVREGGTLWLTVPFGKAFQGDWFRVYDPDGLAALVAGYSVTEKKFARRVSRLAWELCDETTHAISEGLPINGVALLEIKKEGLSERHCERKTTESYIDFPRSPGSRKNFIRVSYGQSVHGEEEIEAVCQVLRTSTLAGLHVREFEKKVSLLFGKRFGIMVNSGSSANCLSVELLGLPNGSEVITPVLTFSTTVTPLIRSNLVPCFIDVEKGSYNIDLALIEERITPQTRAMMIPSLIGNLPDWDVIESLAKKHNLIVIEDSCDTLGATLRGRRTGERSCMSTTSFYGSHVINCAGNGGMLCVDDEDYAARARILRSWGRTSSLFVESESIENRFNAHLGEIPYDAKFVFPAVGYNFEPSELGAAFGLVQLKRLPQNIEARIANFEKHLEFFRDYEEYFILPVQLREAQTGWLAFPLTVRDTAPFSRRDMQIFFEQRNIQTRTIFTGNILRQPGFSSIQCRKNSRGYPQADLVTRGGILLACHHGLTSSQIDHIHETFHALLHTRGLRP